MKRRPPIDRTDPELARRFVDRDEADRLSAVSRRKVVLWCDGAVQGLSGAVFGAESCSA